MDIPPQALGGLESYVIIGDHLFNPKELRQAYYSQAAAFNAASNCLTIRWDGANRLIIGCNGSTIDANHINVQRHQIGNVVIAYENGVIM